MSASRPTWLLLAALALAAAACSSVRITPEIRYYVLAIPHGAGATLSAPVRIGTFAIDDPYATRQLAYRTSPYRLAYYNYHRWAGSPEGIVAAAVRAYFGPSRQPAADAPFEIRARVRRLEEVDEETGWYAALAIDFSVHRNGALVLERAYDEREPAARQKPEAVVAALSRALARIVHALADELAALDIVAEG